MKSPAGAQHDSAREAAALLEELWARVEPALGERGYELVDLTYRREQRGWVLRVTVDRPGGLNVEQAVRLTRDLGVLLDADPRLDGLLRGPYHLEVSTPGIFRELKRPRDFERAWGKRLRVHFAVEPGRTREVVGVLKAYGEGAMVIELEGNETLTVAIADILSARLDPELRFKTKDTE